MVYSVTHCGPHPQWGLPGSHWRFIITMSTLANPLDKLWDQGNTDKQLWSKELSTEKVNTEQVLPCDMEAARAKGSGTGKLRSWTWAGVGEGSEGLAT